jgi:hypothetical protein
MYTPIHKVPTADKTGVQCLQPEMIPSCWNYLQLARNGIMPNVGSMSGTTYCTVPSYNMQNLDA